MQGDPTTETGWSLIAASDEIAAIIDAALRMDGEETYSRSELAETTGIALKTLHLSDDVDRAVSLGVLDRHDADGEEVTYSVNIDSDVLETAREFGEAVAAAQSD